MYESIITSKDNGKIKLYQKLCTLKKARNEYNMFTLEGVRLVCDAILENAELNCILATKTFFEKYSEAVDLLKSKNLYDKVITISDELAIKLSDTKNPQGLFAIAKKLDKIFCADTILYGNKFIILDNLQDPGNVGTIIRTADAVGIDGIFMTEDCCDIYNAKVVRATMGSLFRQQIYCNLKINDIFELFENQSITTYAAVIDKDAQSLVDVSFAKRCATVIGNEGNGLSKETALKCDKRLTIKMNGNINSLNAAMAAGIIMWEMLR